MNVASGAVLSRLRSWSCRKKCQCYQMVRGYGKTQLDHAGVSHDRFAFGQVDFDIVMFEKHSVQRIYGLVHGLLGDEEQSSAVSVVAEFQLLLRRCDQV